jgi:hypothetical protein
MVRSRSTDFDGGGREDAILFFSSVLFFSQLTLVWYQSNNLVVGNLFIFITFSYSN